MSEAALRPLAAVLISALAIPLILASHRRPNLRESWSVLAAVGKFAIVASMLPAVLAGTEFRWSVGVYAPGPGTGDPIQFALRADPLGMLFATLASLLWVFTAFYAAGYMRGLDEHAQTRFFASFAASLSAAVGIAFAENLLTIFVFYELLSVATYPLVAHDETDEARAAGRKYLLYTFFGGGVMVLGGAVLVFVLADTTTFGATADGLASADPTLARAAFAMLATGFGVKAALMPMHSWLPDAMVAPTPVSGLLHAVAVVKSGVFGIARLVLDVYEPQLVGELGVGLPLAAVAAFTLLSASVVALRQDRLKRRLAYSTVSQLSYIVLGLALLGPTALTGGLLHIPAHAFMKLTLFFCAGIIHVETHTDHISEMDGIGKRMPLTMTAFAVAAAGMAGIPLVAGFVSKWFLLIGSVEAGQAVFAVALLLSGVLNVAYFWPIVYGAFFESPDTADDKPLVEGRLGGFPGPRAIQLLTPAGHHGDAHSSASARPAGASQATASREAPASDRDTPAPDRETTTPETELSTPESGELAVDRNPSDHLSGDERDASASDDETAAANGVDDQIGDDSYDNGDDDGDLADDDSDDVDLADGDNDDVDLADGDGDDVERSGNGASDTDSESEHPVYHDHVDHEGQHGGPGDGDWERRAWTGEESTWLMLGPILAVAAGAIVLGIVPYEAVFLRLIEQIVEGVTT